MVFNFLYSLKSVLNCFNFEVTVKRVFQAEQKEGIVIRNQGSG